MTISKVLVTGAAGFIGSHLTASLLDEGHEVVGVDNFCDFYDPALKRRNVEDLGTNAAFHLVEKDIRDRKAMRDTFLAHRPETVVHLAAMAGVRPSIERPDLYTEVNVDGTVSLLDAAVAAKTARFLFASSSSVYGNNEKVPFAETDNVDDPISPYAATKKAGELLCHTWWHLHRMPIVALRFFTVFGPRQRPDLAIGKFLDLVSADAEIPMFGDGSTSRDYTYIDDIVAGIRAARAHCSASMPAPERGEGATTGFRIFNLGGSSPTSLSDMIATLGRVVGRTPRVRRLAMQPGDVNRTFADMRRAASELGYEAQVSFEEGVRRQWRWVQSR